MAKTDHPAAETMADIRPLVARTSSNRAVWIFSGILLASAIGLFAGLEARRTTISTPAVTAPREDFNGMISGPPELAIPPDFADYHSDRAAQFPTSPTLLPQPQIVQSAAPRSAFRQSPVPSSQSQDYFRPSEGLGGQGQSPPPAPAYVFQANPRPSPLGDAARPVAGETRALASRFVNPATSVPQGTVIQAVLETALDSNRPGFARAIISRDVSSFDGSRVLIPRGSRLLGEYKADLSQGQNRALIQWHRLTRPDGTIIDVDSPSADPLGRAGVKGKVNTHFFARFGNAILQSTLDIGVQLATRRAAGNTVILAPNLATQNLVTQKPEEIRPTVTVKQGASVSVFVARDLDFTAVEP